MASASAHAVIVQCDDGQHLQLTKYDTERSGLLRDLPAREKSSDPVPLPFSWQSLHDWHEERPEQLSTTRLMSVVKVRARSALSCAAVHTLL